MSLASTMDMPLSRSRASAPSKILSGGAVTSSDLAFTATMPHSAPKASMLSQSMSACLFWATSWYTTSARSANIAYSSGFVASPSTGIIAGLPSLFLTSSRNMRGANSTQTTFPSLAMSATWDGVVPLEAPRYSTVDPLLMGSSLPPTDR